MEERIPPHSDEAERSVLGAAMLDFNALMTVLELLRPEDFYQQAHKEIFEAIQALHRSNTSVDLVTVCEELKKRKTLDMVGGRSYVVMLPGEVPAVANAEAYADIVRDKAKLRKLILVASDLMEKSYIQKVDAKEVIEYAEQNVFTITKDSQKRDYTRLEDVLATNMKELDALTEAGGNLTGVTTGFKDLDDKTKGLQKSDMIILAARPSMGKTALMLNIALNASAKGATVMMFSLEMAKEQLSQRMLSIESLVELSKMRTGDLSKADWEDLNIAIDRLAGANIYIDDTPGISLMEMKNKCRRLKMEKGLDLVIVDYLQLMSLEGRSESRQNEVSMISRMLKQLAREMECPVIVLSQLSRAVESRQDRRPMMSDLRESGAIEQDADVIMFLYRDEYYNPDTENPNTCEVIIAKQRNGETGTINLAWLGKYTKFANKAKDADIPPQF